MIYTGPRFHNYQDRLESGKFDFRRQKSFPHFGPGYEFPPINPGPLRGQVYIYVSRRTIVR